MLIIIELHGILDQILHCPVTGMQNCDEASLSIILAGWGL